MEFNHIPVAYVRGEFLAACATTNRICSIDPDINGKPLNIPDSLMKVPLDALTDAEASQILDAGRAAGLKLYHFKNPGEPLPRVKKVLGYLCGITFSTLLDVGSGRGVFLWPFMERFDKVDVTSMELLPRHVERMQRIHDGGIGRLTPILANLCDSDSVAPHSQDVVTMLEVLEHIPDTMVALKAALRITRQYLIISVPSKPDNNPEHIHLFTKETLTQMLAQLGCTRLHFDAVNGHILVFASVGSTETEEL